MAIGAVTDLVNVVIFSDTFRFGTVVSLRMKGTYSKKTVKATIIVYSIFLFFSPNDGP